MRAFPLGHIGPTLHRCAWSNWCLTCRDAITMMGEWVIEAKLVT